MLSEYRVIELSDYPAGSILGMHLADQGAEVIMVEPVNTSEKFVSRQDLEFSVWNRGKKSFALPYPGIRYANQADNTEFQLSLIHI